MNVVALNSFGECGRPQILYHLISASNNRIDDDLEIFRLLESRFLSIKDNAQIVTVIDDAIKFGWIEIIVGWHEFYPFWEERWGMVFGIGIGLLRGGCWWRSDFLWLRRRYRLWISSLWGWILLLLLKLLQHQSRIIFLHILFLSFLMFFQLFFSRRFNCTSGEIKSLCEFFAWFNEVFLINFISIKSLIIIIFILIHPNICSISLFNIFSLLKNKRMWIPHKWPITSSTWINNTWSLTRTFFHNFIYLLLFIPNRIRKRPFLRNKLFLIPTRLFLSTSTPKQLINRRRFLKIFSITESRQIIIIRIRF